MRLIFRVEHVHYHDECLITELNKLATAIENLRREVAEAEAGQASAIALLVGLRDRLEQMVNDSANYAELQAEVDALSQELSDSTDALAAAVVEPGTGEEPAPAPFEGPVENGNVNPGPAEGEA